MKGTRREKVIIVIFLLLAGVVGIVPIGMNLVLGGFNRAVAIGMGSIFTFIFLLPVFLWFVGDYRIDPRIGLFEVLALSICTPLPLIVFVILTMFSSLGMPELETFFLLWIALGILFGPANVIRLVNWQVTQSAAYKEQLTARQLPFHGRDAWQKVKKKK